MKVFVAGATGAIGRRLVPRLIERGHSVVALTRTAAKAATVGRFGAEPVVADGLDGKAIRAAVSAAQPDVIVHQMTDLKGAADLRHFDRLFAVSNRLRTEGTDHLMAAGREAGVRRFIAQSYCGWPYAREGDPVKPESAPLDPDPPKQLRAALDAIRYVEATVTGASDMDGLVLRYGGFYGRDTGVFDGPLIGQVLQRRVPVIGSGDGWWSFLHIDDAAEATAIAVERGASGIYNIVDDDPAPAREWLPELARMLLAKPPLRVPEWIARIVAPEHIVSMMTRVRAGSNDKAKQDFGWQPAHPSWRQGFAEIIGEVNRARVAA